MRLNKGRGVRIRQIMLKVRSMVCICSSAVTARVNTPIHVSRSALLANCVTYLAMTMPALSGNRLASRNLCTAVPRPLPKGKMEISATAPAIMGTRPNTVVNASAAAVCAHFSVRKRLATRPTSLNGVSNMAYIIVCIPF